MSVAREKKLAAEAAAQLVEDGMIVGLGTGSTVACLLPALAVRGLDLRCVATSPATKHLARDLGIKVEPFRGAMALARLDVAIDGADQVAPSGWLVKGGGAAHTREKAVAAAAERFIVTVSSDKLVERLAPPVPLELLEFGASLPAPSSTARSRNGPTWRCGSEPGRPQARSLSCARSIHCCCSSARTTSISTSCETASRSAIRSIRSRALSLTCATRSVMALTSAWKSIASAATGDSGDPAATARACPSGT